jgi:spore maturation protein CgeB
MSIPLHLMLVGRLGGTHIGESLLDGAAELGIRAEIVLSSPMTELGIFRRVLQKLAIKAESGDFKAVNERLLERAISAQVNFLIATGIPLISISTLRGLKAAGIATAVYVTDDPWNPNYYHPRRLEALLEYDVVFTPRQSNIEDFKNIGVKQVEYLGFGYEHKHFSSSQELCEQDIDLLFVGGADKDRVSLLGKLGLFAKDLCVAGGYWERYSKFSNRSFGLCTPAETRELTHRAKINLILTRRANRDGHVMRSFEAAACGGCILAEDTAEHRQIYGDTVLYFGDSAEMIFNISHLLDRPSLRASLAAACHARITQGQNRYVDRLAEMLEGLRAVS